MVQNVANLAQNAAKYGTARDSSSVKFYHDEMAKDFEAISSGTAKVISFNFKHDQAKNISRVSAPSASGWDYDNRAWNNTSDQEKKYVLKFERPLGYIYKTSTAINFAHEFDKPISDVVNINAPWPTISDSAYRPELKNGYRVKVSFNQSSNWTECLAQPQSDIIEYEIMVPPHFT